MPRSIPQRTWTDSDSALWYTVRILSDIQARRVPQDRVATYFPLQHNELAFHGGAVAIDEFGPAGDGSYLHSSGGVYVGEGRAGLAIGAAMIAANAYGNRARRQQAEADARSTWRPFFRGDILVTSQGFYLIDTRAVNRWHWDAIGEIRVVGFNVIELRGEAVDRDVMWRISSHWAELVFVLWSMARHPQHPQFTTSAWIPPNWTEWASAQGHPPHPVSNPLES